MLLMFFGNVGEFILQFRIGGLLGEHLELFGKKLLLREKVVDGG